VLDALYAKMKMITSIRIATGTLDEVRGEGLVLGLFADERPPGRCGLQTGA